VYKLDHSSFTRCRDIIGARKFKMGYVTLTTPPLKVICTPYVGTWHNFSVYKIWSL